MNFVKLFEKVNNRLKTLPYQRLVASGKPKKLALTACMRKLLVRLNSIVKNNSDWNPEHVFGA
jgi:transposase